MVIVSGLEVLGISVHIGFKQGNILFFPLIFLLKNSLLVYPQFIFEPKNNNIKIITIFT